MSSPSQEPPDVLRRPPVRGAPQDRPRSSQASRRRARVLLPAGFIAVLVIIFLIILLVSRCGSGDDDVYRSAGVAPTGAAVLAGGAAT